MTKYGPDSDMTNTLCKLIESNLPGVRFKFSIEREGLRVSGQYNSRYFEQLLREQSPQDVISEFRDRLRYQ